MIEYRPAEPAEFPVAAELRHEMGLEMGSDFDQAGDRWRTRFSVYFRGKQHVNRGQLFMAFENGTAIGMAAVSLTDEWRAFCFNTRFAHVNAVYVKPEYRRRGVARELMQRAIAWAKAKGCSRIRLRTSEEGRALYESVGFAPGREMEMWL